MLQQLFDGCLQLDTSEQTAVFFDQLRQLPACKGIVLFADEDDNPIKLQIAADIRRTARAKLTTQDDHISPKTDLAPVTTTIYYTCCHNDFRAMFYHYLAARTIYPDNYKELTALPEQTYAAVDLSFAWPYFFSSSSPVPTDKVIKFGLFPSRKAANHLIDTCNAVFCLCRRPDLIRKNDQKTCPYMQMQTCDAPCTGNISREQYNAAVQQAISVAGGEIEEQIQNLHSQMLQAASRMQFEKAGELKKKLIKLDSLKRPNYRWMHNISDLAVLHIDGSKKVKQEDSRKKVQTYSAFLVRADMTTEFDDFQLSDTSKALANLEDQQTRSLVLQDDQQVGDRLALLAYFLFRTTATGLWLDVSRQTPSPEDIRKMIADYFEMRADSESQDTK